MDIGNGKMRSAKEIEKRISQLKLDKDSSYNSDDGDSDGIDLEELKIKKGDTSTIQLSQEEKMEMFGSDDDSVDIPMKHKIIL